MLMALIFSHILLFWLLNLIIFNIKKRKRPLLVILCSFIFTILSYLFFSSIYKDAFQYESKIFEMIGGVCIFLIVSIGYLQFYSMLQESISFKILLSIDKSSKKQLTLEELGVEYDFSKVLDFKIKEAVQLGLISKEQKETFQMTMKGRLYAVFFNIVRKMHNWGI